jgi:tetratricopeptide (TPR) repeat protein
MAGFHRGAGADAAIDQFLREAPLLRDILRRVAEDTKLVEEDLARGDWATARAKLEQQLKLWEAAQDLEKQAEIHSTLGVVDVAQGNLPAAQAHLETALQLAQRLRDAKREASAWLMMSWLHFCRGRGEEADVAMREAAKLIDRRRLVELHAGFLSWVAFLRILGSDNEKTAEVASMALEEIRRSGDKQGVSEFFLVLGMLLMLRHNMNGLLLICLAEAASSETDGAPSKALSSFFRGYEEGAAKPFEGPEVQLLRDHARAAWQHDRGESLLVRVLVSEPGKLSDSVMGRMGRGQSAGASAGRAEDTPRGL